MIRLFQVCALAVLFAFTATAFGQEPSPSPSSPSQTDLAAIRQMIEQQSHQIEILTQQVERLNQIIEHSSRPPAAAAAADTTPPVQETNPGASPVSSSGAEIPKAEAVDRGPTHVVIRGETLTSIAKQYKVSLAELIKVNKIANDRALQIGQTLTIPAPKSNDSPRPKEKP